MLEAENLRVLGRHIEAVAAYRRALRFERRPEIYLQLGLTQVEAGQEKEAFIHLLKAVSFDSRLLSAVPFLEIRSRLEKELTKKLGILSSTDVPPVPRSITDGPFPRVYPAGSLQSETGKSEGPIKLARIIFDDAGWLVFGPGEELPPGRYRVRFSLRLDSPSPRQGRPAIKLDVTSDRAGTEKAALVIRPNDLDVGVWKEFVLHFSANAPMQWVEYRVYWFATTNLSCGNVIIERF